MDCQMPEMDGLTATRRIRGLESEIDRRPTPIIAVTANAFAEDRAACLEAGMDDYVSKPFSETQLKQLLVRWAPQTRQAVLPTVTQQTSTVALPSATSALSAIAVTTAADVKPAIALPAKSAESTPPAPSAKATPVPPAAAAPSAPAIDLEVLGRMQKTHPTLVVRLLDTYLGYAPKAIDQLLAALAAEDLVKLKTTAHSLKSSSANVGAMQLSGLCRELEARLKNATTWDGQANVEAVTEIEAAFQAAMSMLGELKTNLANAPPVAAKPKTATA